MNKQILIIMFGIVLISLVSAMYAGNTETFDFGYEIVNCSIINNTYNLEGLNLAWNNTNATVSTVVNYKPENFIISCWVIKYGEVEEYRSSGGGSSRGTTTISCTENWSCSNWGDCTDKAQTRFCTDLNNCKTIQNKPSIVQGCTIEEESEEIITIPQNFLSRITGAAIGTLGTTGSIVVLIFILLIILGITFILIKKRKKMK